MNINAERRQFERFLFSSESNVKVKLNLFDNDDTSIVADITNLSEEGLGLSFGNTLPVSLCEGDWIMLKRVEGPLELKLLAGLEMKLKWIMSYNPSRGTRFGCLFANISPAAKEQIRKFICTRIDQNLNDKENLESKMAACSNNESNTL
jgi:c-di-GMP-binding flagellar brake protein YcgR